MVNLDDQADCQRGMKHLRRLLNNNPDRLPGKLRGEEKSGFDCPNGPDKPALTLPQRLNRISQRGIWKHLVKIARNINEPKSLPELDEALNLPKNKMRSLKAIMGKVENRWEIVLLRPAPNAGEDASGNPRYIMPPHVRKAILNISDREA